MSVYQLTEGASDINILEFNINRDDPSLNQELAPTLQKKYNTDKMTLDQLFLNKYSLDYITKYFSENKKPLRVLSFPKSTDTCYEKADILENWNPLNVIKAFYLESSLDRNLYAVIVPETGCFLDRNLVSQQLNLPDNVILKKAENLPEQMSFGSCSPFIRKEDLIANGGKVRHIIFDKETLILKRHENNLDDFSFGLEHRLSIQLNYYHCYKMLRSLFGDIVIDKDILRLSFKERLIRKKGNIKIDYEFKTINYRTAQFINNIHGYGDVSIINDHIDELYIPDVLTSQDITTR